jgi:hypothetical protein
VVEPLVHASEPGIDRRLEPDEAVIDSLEARIDAFEPRVQLAAEQRELVHDQPPMTLIRTPTIASSVPALRIGHVITVAPAERGTGPAVEAQPMCG